MISPVEIIDQAEYISLYSSNLVLQKYQLNHNALLFNLSPRHSATELKY
jgi:hypothetical protein